MPYHQTIIVATTAISDGFFIPCMDVISFFNEGRSLKHTMKEPKLNGPSTVEFFINDEKVGEMDITATVYAGYTGHETFDIGRDEGLPVNEEYADQGKFKFTEGQLHKVIFDILNPGEQEVSTAAYSVIE
jgi:hypothetical protein